MIKQFKYVQILLLSFALVFLPGCPGKVTGVVKSIASNILQDKFYFDPGTTTVVASSDFTLTAKNSSGSVVYAITSGSGVVSSEGVYNSQGYVGLVIIEAKDSAGNIAYINLNVVDQLKAFASTQEMMAGTLNTVVAQGGLAPYTFAVVSGSGQVDSMGSVIAGSVSGNLVVEVKDALEQSKQVVIAIQPELKFTQDVFELLTGQAQTIAASGGVGGLSYSLKGLGQLDSSSGLYIAPSAQGIAVLKVTDTQGNSASTFLKISGGVAQAALNVSPTSLTMTIGQKQKFSVFDGEAPYTISKVSGSGTVDAANLEFTAVAAGTTVLKIADNRGIESGNITVVVKDVMSIDVGSGTQLSGNEMTVVLGGTVTLTPGGSEGPFTYSSILGSVQPSQDTSTAVYTPPNTSGTDVITITDSLGNTSRVYVKIQESLKIAPNPVNLAKNGVMQFMAIGGEAPYKFSIASGEGTVVEESGYFVAPSTAQAVTIKVTDKNDNSATASVTVYDSLNVSPFYKVSIAARTEEFTIAGGVGPYTLTASNGLLCESDSSCTSAKLNKDSSGKFKVKLASAEGTANVTVEDAQNNESSATVKINAALAVAADKLKLVPSEKSVLQITGGIAPYTASIINGTGAITQTSSSKFEYQAPASIASQATATVKITDTEGTEVLQNFTLYPALTIAASVTSILKSQSATLTISGGTGDYTVTKLSGPGSLGALNTSTNEIIFTADAAQIGLSTIEVTDEGSSKLHSAQLTMRTSEVALATLSGAPSPISNATTLNVIISGTDITHYRYALVTQTDLCSLATYGSSTPIATNITGNLGADGNYKLCVVGRTTNGTWQEMTVATSVSWSKDTSAPVLSFLSSSNGGIINIANKSNFVVTGSCSENLRNVQLSIQGESSNPYLCSSQVWSANIDFASRAEGTIAISITQEDVAGNVSLPVTLNLTKDTAVPIVSFISPSANSYINDQTKANFTIQGTCSEAGLDVAVSIASTNYTSSCSGGSFNGSFDLSSIVDGAVNIVIGQTDLAGNQSASTTITVTKDVVAPSAPSNLQDGTTSISASATPTLTWSASTASDLNHYQLAIGSSSGAVDILAYNDIGNVTTKSVTGLTLTRGQNYFASIKALDNAGNSSETVTSDGWFVNLAPVISSVSPTSGDVTGGTSLTITGSNFVNGAIVKIGSVSCASTTFVNASTLTCVTAAGSAGTYNVNVDNPDTLTGTLTNGFSYSVPIGSWTAITTTGAPSGRYAHVALWTGSRMLIWGGQTNAAVYTNSGALFDPIAGTWTSIATSVLTPRSGSVGVWTGSKMIVWGGRDSNVLNDGATYDLATNTWSSISSASAPVGRIESKGVWTGTDLIVWGGYYGMPTMLNSGGVYNLATNTWTATATLNAPPPASNHISFWTGSRMVVWGGTNYTGSVWEFRNSGGIYNPSNNTWTSITTTSALSKRRSSQAIWTGARAFIWGGVGDGGTLNDGAYLDVDGDNASWTPIAMSNAPSGEHSVSAIFTGTRMLILKGAVDGTNHSYDLASNLWSKVSITNAPSYRSDASVVWTGSKAIIWGGSDNTNTGGIFNPGEITVAQGWTDLSTTNAPSARYLHNAEWTGSKMIIWGGYHSTGDTYLNSGGVFDPISNSWSAISTTGAPQGRRNAFGVWTGKRLLIWGGQSASGLTNSGALYDPQSDSWSAMTLTNAPTASYVNDDNGKDGIFTGSKFVYYGGGGYSQIGGIYDVNNNTWTTISTTNAPAGRAEHLTLWTGTKMLVWGGGTPASVNTGGIFDPNTNTWTAGGMSTTGAPSARYMPIGIWAGNKMMVFGGTVSTALTNTGGFYDPNSNSWSALSNTNAPVCSASVCRSVIVGNRVYFIGNISGPTMYFRYFDLQTSTWNTVDNVPLTVGSQSSMIYTGSILQGNGANLSRLNQSGDQNKLIFFGGFASSALGNTGAIYQLPY